MRQPATIPLILLLLAAMSCCQLTAQEAQFGVALPLTISGGILDTARARYADPTAPHVFGGFRLLAMPQIKLGSHWYGYSALRMRLTPYFYEDTYVYDRQIKLDVLQAFLGYTRSWNHTAIAVKIGKLSSAFGSFPLRYDDMTNPLLDQPLPYNYLLEQPSSSSAEKYGLTPVSLYGLPAAEFDLSWHRVDTRFQFTTSNPYNPLSILATGQYPQWTAGGGYTIREGFRVGMSAHRGPWLDGSFASVVPPGLSTTDFPASGVGVDVQWARGRWSATGEWERFAHDFPYLSNARTLYYGYAELKVILHPRWYAAFRPNFQTDNHAVIGGVESSTTVFPNRQYYEVAVGFRPDRFQLLKVGYEWAEVDNGEVNHNNVFGVRFITSINGLSKALK